MAAKTRKTTATKSKVATAKAAKAEKSETIIAYKGFNTDLTCRDFQYEVGKTYKHDGAVKACESGFHACEHPLDVFKYYPPATSRFGVVEMVGKTSRDGSDTKIAAAEITIKAEIKLPELIQAAVKYVFDRVKWIDGPVAKGPNEAATASGTRGAATASGTRGAATASGDQGAATASGDQGAATASGTHGAATASGTRGAATASGDQGAATASGDQGAATASGYQGAATASGYQGAATASGINGKARGSEGCALFLVERRDEWGDDFGKIINVWAGIVGHDGIKPDTFYRLVDGKPVECD